MINMDIQEEIQRFNPWWTQKFQVEYKERKIYQKLQKYMETDQIIALTGLRRTGKTTLMQKVIQDQIKKGKNPEDILYFSFDEFQNIEIKKILKAYQEIFNKDLRKEETLLLLDEVQKLENWSNQAKTIYDLHKGNMKIMISGSESLFIRKEIKETLAGRMYEFKVKPLTFKEYLTFKEKKEELKPLNLYKKELKYLFQEYTKTMGFPELTETTDKEIIHKYIKENIMGKVIYKDLETLFNTRATEKLESILKILMEKPGQIIKIQDLAKDLGITRQTLSNYLTYLEKSFLIKKLYNYSENQRKTERKLRKFYPTILSPNLLFKEDTYSQSQVFEWILANQLETDFFWRDQYKNEVDFIQTPKEPNKKPIPIEAKYGKIETKGLEKFMDKFNLQEGRILTKDKEKEIEKKDKTIHVEPAYKYLLRE